MITSNSNQKIKNVISLITSSKARKEQKKYVVEGIKMFLEAPLDLIDEIYVSESFIGSKESVESKNSLKPEAIKALSNSNYEVVTDQVFKKMSDTVSPQGILCVIKKVDYKIEKLISNKDRLRILVLEGIQDPGNLGTMIRTSEAAGFDFILADKNTVDVYNTKVIRSTMGSVYRIPVLYTDDLLNGISILKANGVFSYAAHLKGNKFFNEIEYSNKSAIYIGNEGKGLSDVISDTADVLVKIPMEGKVESLNAAVAASLMMFEVKR